MLTEEVAFYEENKRHLHVFIYIYQYQEKNLWKGLGN